MYFILNTAPTPPPSEEESALFFSGSLCYEVTQQAYPAVGLYIVFGSSVVLLWIYLFCCSAYYFNTTMLSQSRLLHYGQHSIFSTKILRRAGQQMPSEICSRFLQWITPCRLTTFHTRTQSLYFLVQLRMLVLLPLTWESWNRTWREEKRYEL